MFTSTGDMSTLDISSSLKGCNKFDPLLLTTRTYTALKCLPHAVVSVLVVGIFTIFCCLYYVTKRNIDTVSLIKASEHTVICWKKIINDYN